MAKRARGSTSRPGQRPPLQRQGARAVTRQAASIAPEAPRPDALTEAEEARAAELEAAIVADERQAEASKRRLRPARTVDADAPRTVSNLSLSAAEEYQYVARDVRRISIVGGSLVVILLGLWVLSHFVSIGSL